MKIFTDGGYQAMQYMIYYEFFMKDGDQEVLIQRKVEVVEKKNFFNKN
jgi:hypothetical protein